MRSNGMIKGVLYLIIFDSIESHELTNTKISRKINSKAKYKLTRGGYIILYSTSKVTRFIQGKNASKCQS